MRHDDESSWFGIESPKFDLESPELDHESPRLDLDSPKLGRESSRFTRDALNLAIDSSNLYDDTSNLDLDSSRCTRDAPKFDGESVSLANNHQRPNVQASGPTRELAEATNALAGHMNVQPIFHGLRIELDLKGQGHAPLLPEESPGDSI